MLFYHRATTLPLILASMDTNASTLIAPTPAVQLQPTPQRQPVAPFVIGVDLGGTQTRAAVVRDHEIVARISRPTPSLEGPESVIAGIVATIHTVMQMAEIGFKDVRGIGLGAPGPLNSRLGIVYEAPNLRGWKDIHLRDELAKSFTVPVYVGHDASIAALAEYRYGAARDTIDMVYMTISTGIGGGIIIDGTILEGVTGTAGEIGHIIVDLSPNAPRDGSGHIGCLESLASGTALARDANALIASGQGQGILAVYRELVAKGELAEQLTTEGEGHHSGEFVRARDVVEAAQRGDPEASAMVAKAAYAIGIGCINLINTLNPEMIVIGGGVAHAAGDLLFGPMIATLKQRTFARPVEATKIVPAHFGNDVGLIGAAAYVDYRQGNAPAHNAGNQRGPTTL